MPRSRGFNVEWSFISSPTFLGMSRNKILIELVKLLCLRNNGLLTVGMFLTILGNSVCGCFCWLSCFGVCCTIVFCGAWMGCSGWWLYLGWGCPAVWSFISGRGVGSRSSIDGFDSSGCTCLFKGCLDSRWCEEGPNTWPTWKYGCFNAYKSMEITNGNSFT